MKLIDNMQNGIMDASVDNGWNFGDEPELLMHTIHAYPAKFPAFIATKAFNYAKSEGVNVESVADVFCGCGTVALEAKMHNKNFWGCDINPVATLIARTKSAQYDLELINRYFSDITSAYIKKNPEHDIFTAASGRMKYWFTEASYVRLYKLKSSILECVPQGEYRDAFLCLFSSILKASSKWLTKSIKPQIDPDKPEIDIWIAFEKQYRKFYKAIVQIQSQHPGDSRVVIQDQNFLEYQGENEVDLIISSPPYVTSYEYADLHQLSALWLGYTEDYRSLREGSIGSIHNSGAFELNFNALNPIGQQIVLELQEKLNTTYKVRAIARYYVDIQRAIHNCARMLKKDGMALFVVGDTEYQGVKILNSAHLIQCMKDENFHEIKAGKRKISRKILTPYRDEKGRFSSDKSKRTVYHEEYVISGRQ